MELTPADDGVRVVMTVEPLHDQTWTDRLLAGRANELDNLATLIAQRNGASHSVAGRGARRARDCCPRSVDQSAEPTVSGAVVDHSWPNHRWIRLAPNSAFCAASARDGPSSAPIRWSPKKVTSTSATSSPPNSR